MNIDGLILESKFPEYQFLIKGPFHKVWRDGFPVDEQKILILQFDRYICMVDDMVQEQEWTEEDKEFALRQLEVQMNNPKYRDMYVHVPKRPDKPWPTYDDTHHKQIPNIAVATGTVHTALAYERTREGGGRPEVVAKLEELALQDLEGTPAPVQEDEMVAL
jgi:hypothetical protein